MKGCTIIILIYRSSVWKSRFYWLCFFKKSINLISPRIHLLFWFIWLICFILNCFNSNVVSAVIFVIKSPIQLLPYICTWYRLTNFIKGYNLIIVSSIMIGKILHRTLYAFRTMTAEDYLYNQRDSMFVKTPHVKALKPL